MKAIRAGALVIIALLIFSCGGHNRTLKSLQDSTDSPIGVAQPREYTLDDTLAQLDAMAVPDSVQPEVFQKLKDELARQLKERYSSRIVSKAPAGELSSVSDLTVNDGEGGFYYITWHYRNAGDYNQDGEVNISDITPIAMNYGRTLLTGDETSALSVVDGDGNDSIGITDVTPLAANFLAQVDEYSLEGSPENMEAFDRITTIGFNEGTGAGRLLYTLVIDPGTWEYFRVRPLDAVGTPGVPSIVRSTPYSSPFIRSALPATGTKFASATFKAEVWGATPLTYSWNFGGCATPNTSFLASPTVTFQTSGNFSASLTVTNDYGSDGLGFSINVSDAPPTPAKWHVMVFIAADNNLGLVTAYDMLTQGNFSSNSSVISSVAYDINCTDQGGDHIAGIAYIGDETAHNQEFNGITYDSASPQSLLQYLNWAKTNYPADKYMLVLYDHGDSWTKNTSGILVDYTTNPGHQLEISELAQTINQSGLNIEVLTFRACLMASIEVMADLDNAVDYVVASQTLQQAGKDNASYPFAEIVTWLQQNPNTTARGLAIKNSDLYAQRFSGLADASTATSAVECAKVPTLVESISALRSALSSVVASRKTQISSAMTASWRFVTGDGDLGAFLDQIDILVPDAAVQSAVTDTKSKLAQAVINNKLHYDADDMYMGDIRNCKGLNIWLPVGFQQDAERISQYRTLSFAQDTNWDDLLDQLNGSSPNNIVDGAEMFGLFGWTPELVDGGPEVDLYVLEPTWDTELLWVSSPAFGLSSLNGYLSPDSWDTGYSWECWSAKSLIYKGVYICAANYYSDGSAWVGCDVAFIGGLRGSSQTFGPYYLDSEVVYDEDMGPGWIPFAYIDRSVSSLGTFRQSTLREAGLTDTQIASAVAQLKAAERAKRD